MLSAAVDAAVRIRFDAGDRADSDDMTVVTLFEVVDEYLGEFDKTGDVGGVHQGYVVVGDISHSFDALDETGVVDENVDVGEIGSLENSGDVFVAGHI